MSWYVIEGPDDTGKTTLARGLERRGWKYLHADGRSTLPTYAERLSQLQRYVNVVLDRAHLGEMVHGPLDRKTTPNIGWFRLIEAFLLEKRAHGVLLLVRPAGPETWENDIFRHATLASRFQEVALSSSLHWGGWPDPMPMVGGYNDTPLFDERFDVEGLGGLWPESFFKPEVWVLGERQNPNADVPWPFSTRCGVDLVWPVINPREVRVSNSMPSSWRQKVANPYADLHDRWHSLGHPPVICLGRQTMKNCQKADVEVQTYLPHPQFWLRFHASDPEIYRYHLAQAILNAMRGRVC